jgi:hypothetical protein
MIAKYADACKGRFIYPVTQNGSVSDPVVGAPPSFRDLVFPSMGLPTLRKTSL